MKVLIGIPTDNNMKIPFVSSSTAMLMAAHAKYPDLHFHQMFIQGVRTDKNRNSIVDFFLKNDFDAILFLDSDMEYPDDMLIKYIASDKELIGGVYFKRSKPHHPVVYMFSGNSDTPFHTIDPLAYGKDVIVPVDGLGTGGMFIKRSVFDKLKVAGQDPWFKYGDNYHLPYKTSDQTTHDLVFCKKAREAGVEIFLHTGVRMGHITDVIITEYDWYEDRKEEAMDDKTVELIIPVYGADSYPVLKKCIESIKLETEYPDYLVHVVVDGDPALRDLLVENPIEFSKLRITYSDENMGWPNIVNKVINESKNNWFAYLGCDVIMGQGWLTEAMGVHRRFFPDRDGLVAFNDGKWKGKIASHGLVHRNILRYTGSTLFYPYHHYQSDLELSELMKREGKYVYAYDSVVYHEQAKVGRSEAKDGLSKAKEHLNDDIQIYKQRLAQGFPLH